MKEEGIIAETKKTLILIEALEKISSGTEDVLPPWRAMPKGVMMSIARIALRAYKGEEL